MKLSVSLPDEDVAFLDAYGKKRGIPSRSAVLHSAIRALRASELGAAYEDAWGEWEESEEGAWESTAADGLTAS